MGRKRKEVGYSKRLQAVVKGPLLKAFEVYLTRSGFNESELVREAVEEKLIRENAYRVGRFSGHQGTS